jgi:hypothetical protein
MQTKIATPEQIAALQAQGYYVEDMGAEWGAEWAGKFRWMKRDSDEFQDWDTSDSEAEAWACLVEYKGL